MLASSSSCFIKQHLFCASVWVNLWPLNTYAFACSSPNIMRHSHSSTNSHFLQQLGWFRARTSWLEHVPEGKLCSAVAFHVFRRFELGEPVSHHASLPPVVGASRCATRIGVVDECSLSVAKCMGKGYMLVVGRGIGPPTAVHTRFSQCTKICRTTTLQLAMIAAAAVPRWSGIYVPDVVVSADSNHNQITPFRIAMMRSSETK